MILLIQITSMAAVIWFITVICLIVVIIDYDDLIDCNDLFNHYGVNDWHDYIVSYYLINDNDLNDYNDLIEYNDCWSQWFNLVFLGC